MELKSKNKYLSIAKEAALLSGKYLNSLNHNKSVLKDKGKDIKLLVDKGSEKIIINHLRKTTKIKILSEESGLVDNNNIKLRWVVDPLDGSLNFSRNLPICSVSISLWESDKPILGVVYDFYRQEIFYGIVGVGAWLNKNSISVSAVKKQEKAIIMTGFPSATNYSASALRDYINSVKSFKKVRLLGSAALSLAYVASGRADVYFEKDIRLWDVAGGLAIVKAAGGSFMFKKTKIIENTFVVYASNKLLKNNYEKYFKEKNKIRR